MSLRAFIRARKVIVDQGAWSDKRMPKTGGKYPLTKTRSLRVGAVNWRWRVIRLGAGSNEYRLFVGYNTAKREFHSVVGLDLGESTTLVLGRLENHATHPGLHMHGCCQAADKRNSGRTNYPDMVRMPTAKQNHRLKNQTLSDGAAIEIVARYFRIRGLDEDSPQQSEMIL